MEDADVLVVGSGMAGICAAMQAARLGCSVILVEKDEVLGGNSSVNLGVHISGAHSLHPYAAETGIINEIEEEAARYHAKLRTHTYHYNIARQWDSILKRMLEESGVRVHRRSYAKRAITDGGRISGAIVEDLATYQTKRIEVAIAVVDASGDGQIAYTSGADFRVGREARSEFNERGAPEKSDRITMGTSVTALVRKTSRPVKFVPPPGTPPFEVGYGYGRDRVSKDCLYSHASWDPRADLCFLWHTETGGNRDTIADDHEIYERLILQLYSVWNHIKNEAHPKESENWELVWVSPKAGKRESRRFVGDYILTQTDVENATTFPDAVAYGGYAVDIHDPVGDQARVIFHSIPPLFNIPYRCLYSRNVENLFLAGRLISVTHMGLGAVRLQKTLATAGQAVGAAAALCKKHGCTPRAIWTHHVKELQQLLLQNDATILVARNVDPADIARGARVTASSEEIFECTELDDVVPLDLFRGLVLLDWAGHIERLELYLKNERTSPIDVEVSLRRYLVEKKWKESTRTDKPNHIKGPANRMEWGVDNTRDRFREISRSRASVPPSWEGFAALEFPEGTELPPRDMTSDEERLLILLPPTRCLSWGRRKGLWDFGVSCWARPGDESYTAEPTLHLFKVYPRPSYGEADNVVNGYNRRFSTNPVNMWISKRDEPLPQSVVLDLNEERAINRIHLTFDTIYRSYREMPFNDEDRDVPGMCVREYDIEVRLGRQWKRIASARDNYKRFRVHRFDTVKTSKIRLVVKATNEEGWPARVYEVGVYGP